MENLTHTLVGVMLSRAGLNRQREGEQRFGLMLALAANAPDIDAFPFFYDMLEYLEIHRGPTHAFAFVPLVAMLPIGIVWAINRKRPGAILYWWFASMLAVLSHLLLDWTNVYGIRLLLPFSEEWLHLDITNVIDPFILLILLSALAFPALAGLVGSEISGRKAPKPKRSWAWIALILLSGYEVARWTSHNRALELMDAHLYDGQRAEQIYAFPNGLLPTTWRGVVRAESAGQPAIYESTVDVTGSYSPSAARISFPADPETNPEIAAALTTRTFQVLDKFNQVPFWRVSPAAGSAQDPEIAQVGLEDVQLIDLRFGDSQGGGGFADAKAIVDANGNVREVEFGLGGPPGR